MLNNTSKNVWRPGAPSPDDLGEFAWGECCPGAIDELTSHRGDLASARHTADHSVDVLSARTQLVGAVGNCVLQSGSRVHNL